MAYTTFAELAKERYSVRQFDSSKPVEAEKLAAILEAVTIAPTAANMQPQKVKVLQTPEELALADQISQCRYGAPLAFLICYDSSGTIKHSGLDAGVIDCSIITTHMMLEAWEQGLGSVWCLAFDPDKAREVLGLPQNIVPVAFLPVGYAAEGAAPHPFHTTSKPLADLLL
ncbi:MAG: nitroreductase family protein [Oscillospiraceae bacterium]|jgi:nitroreductase|nr:nitroreductase family protein [Oscillospiraceae bacterium]